ncbi:MAG: hypothetical protein MJ153_05035 [Clostridia bacterium]|nr:hypothetical protein [Clostridia bacterium]
MNCLLSDIINLILSLTMICGAFAESNRMSLSVNAVGNYDDERPIFNVWKYSPDRENGNGITDYGDFLIAQGKPDNQGRLVWNNESYILDLSSYGIGTYGINAIFEKGTENIDSNWIYWDEYTFYRTFNIDSEECYLELSFIADISTPINDRKEILTPNDYLRKEINITKEKSHELIKVVNSNENIEVNKPRSKAAVNLLSYLSLMVSLLILYYVITVKRAD